MQGATPVFSPIRTTRSGAQFSPNELDPPTLNGVTFRVIHTNISLDRLLQEALVATDRRAADLDAGGEVGKNRLGEVTAPGNGDAGLGAESGAGSSSIREEEMGGGGKTTAKREIALPNPVLSCSTPAGAGSEVGEVQMRHECLGGSEGEGRPWRRRGVVAVSLFRNQEGTNGGRVGWQIPRDPHARIRICPIALAHARVIREPRFQHGAFNPEPLLIRSVWCTCTFHLFLITLWPLRRTCRSRAHLPSTRPVASLSIPPGVALRGAASSSDFVFFVLRLEGRRKNSDAKTLELLPVPPIRWLYKYWKTLNLFDTHSTLGHTRTQLSQRRPRVPAQDVLGK
ncbi:hypothetical protein DFH08DRAFT_820396 [Mycena albidolilacea]|uniref:Uncharacterized protein n=1 Tax=Mycena albidolilacea TaxID=1033008 RepID=A0AAD6ZCK5_9AGAR|nr:hypothetical protein DFH08DRAFT_820396 [Mycena albidolilacea]